MKWSDELERLAGTVATLLVFVLVIMLLVIAIVVVARWMIVNHIGV